MDKLLGLLLGMIKEQIETTGGDGGKAVTWEQLQHGIEGLILKAKEAEVITDLPEGVDDRRLADPPVGKGKKG